MKAELKIGSVNQILKGTDIYEAGDAVDTVTLVVKGRIQMHGHGLSMPLGSGSFLGIRNVDHGAHDMTYTAQTNAVVYVFPATGSAQAVQEIIKKNKDYGALLVSNLCKALVGETKIYGELRDASEEMYKFITDTYQDCQEIARMQGIDVGELRPIVDLRPFDAVQTLPVDKVRYYQACSKVASEIQKAFFSSSGDICLYHVREQIGLQRQLYQGCAAYADYLEGLIKPLIIDKKSLFDMVAKLTSAMQHMDVECSQIMKQLDNIIDHINNLETLLVDKSDVHVEINRNYMEETYFALLNPGSQSSSTGMVDTDAGLALVEEGAVDISQLENALENILEYAEMDGETVERFIGLVEQFGAMSDKESTDDDARNLRRSISKEYYPLYKKVFWKDFHATEATPLHVDLFLRFGFLSENLLSENLIEELLALDTTSSGYGGCKVYDMKEWLTAIAKGEREPSKNEFDMDYEESLREKKKMKEITQQEMEKDQRDTVKKVDFEVDNMFRVNHRLVNGQITSFVPFLYTEGCLSSLDRMFLSKDKVNASINRIRRIDFSAFYRESLFTKEVPGIKKEFIQEEVFPDVILMPTAGSRGIMWQELSGRKRNTPGRFLLPIFLESELDKLMIYLVGCFRWELCRTMQGAHWNDISSKSLTSEYSDFLQFYRKNRDLSDDKKEKLKLQIQKNRNNTREIFAVDYTSWMTHESKGGVVLSKPVREIMATYCPFSIDIRKSVEEQPIYKDAMARFNRERGKKLREYDLKFRVWQKDQVDVPEEVTATRDFYRDL